MYLSVVISNIRYFHTIVWTSNTTQPFILWEPKDFSQGLKRPKIETFVFIRCYFHCELLSRYVWHIFFLHYIYFLPNSVLATEADAIYTEHSLWSFEYGSWIDFFFSVQFIYPFSVATSWGRDGILNSSCEKGKTRLRVLYYSPRRHSAYWVKKWLTVIDDKRGKAINVTGHGGP
jgi:hypothetical protein